MNIMWHIRRCKSFSFDRLFVYVDDLDTDEKVNSLPGMHYMGTHIHRRTCIANQYWLDSRDSDLIETVKRIGVEET